MTPKDQNAKKKYKKKKGKIKVFKITYYKGCPVYCRQIGWSIWEYLTVLDGEIYTAYYNFYPHWWKVFYKKPYRDIEVRAILNKLTLTAHATIDFVKDEHKSEKTKNISE